MKCHKQLHTWFLQHRRDLPWREQPTPYGVWVSEVMLQQTQVAVVIPYYERWMVRFPTIADLAQAPVDEVIKLWEGLGYYSRARNLHEGARYVMEHHEGVLPDNAEALAKIKGLGAYTIGAILSFAFHRRVAAVDGNVLRVLARYYALSDDIAKSSTAKKFRGIAQDILPEKEPWIMSEALIELGATVCQKKVKCMQCPLKGSCQAYAQGIQDTLPVKTRNQRSEQLYRAVAVVMAGEKMLIQRVEKGKIMSDLHEFPYFETGPEGISEKKLTQLIQKHFGLRVNMLHSMPSIDHSFTRFTVKLSPVAFQCIEMKHVEGYQWVDKQTLNKLAFSSGHRKLREAIYTTEITDTKTQR